MTHVKEAFSTWLKNQTPGNVSLSKTFEAGVTYQKQLILEVLKSSQNCLEAVSKTTSNSRERSWTKTSASTIKIIIDNLEKES